jgi:hypothetical protein
MICYQIWKNDAVLFVVPHQPDLPERSSEDACQSLISWSRAQREGQLCGLSAESRTKVRVAVRKALALLFLILKFAIIKYI